MKKIVFLIGVMISSLMPVIAQETVKTLYSDGPKEVTWASPLYIPADMFATDVNIGDYIYINFSETTDVIEIKANGTWLPGSRFTFLGDDSADYKAYITADMLDALKKYGLEICGAKFTLTSVCICNDGFQMPEGAIWGGYFWVDSWNTLEIFKTAFEKYDGQRYMDIYLSEDLGCYDGYFMKVLTKWEPETLWANNDQITHTSRMATVDLKDINVEESLADVNAIMIQGNKESGNPFNITAVAFRNDNGASVFSNIFSEDINAVIDVFNIQGVKVKSDVPTEIATDNLSAGFYIIGNKKVLVR